MIPLPFWILMSEFQQLQSNNTFCTFDGNEKIPLTIVPPLEHTAYAVTAHTDIDTPKSILSIQEGHMKAWYY
jgi:hypothetical protein